MNTPAETPRPTEAPSTQNKDTDQDGIEDDDELENFGIDPKDNDTDDDGLLDGEEAYVHNTDPGSFDTDGDGLSDKEEVERGTNPRETEVPTATLTPRPTETATPTATPDIETILANSELINGHEMVEIPAGPFDMNLAHWYCLPPEEVPDLSAERVADESQCEVGRFWISKYVTSNEQYKAFLDSNPKANSRYIPSKVKNSENGECEDWSEAGEFLGQFDLPVVCVEYADVVAYINWLNAGLPSGEYEFFVPTEAEWEKAAGWDEKNQEQRLYPWDVEVNDNYSCFMNSNFGAGITGTSSDCPSRYSAQRAPINHVYDRGENYYGLSQMAGNVWEITSSKFGPPNIGAITSCYEISTFTQENASKDDRVLRGGSYGSKPDFGRTCFRWVNTEGADAHLVGFRVALRRVDD